MRCTLKLLIFILGLTAAQNVLAWQLESATDLKKITVVDAKGARPAKLKEPLTIGMVIQTGPNAKALLVEGQSKFWMGENTKVELKTNDLPNANAKAKLVLVQEGKARFEIKKTEAEKYFYRTPSAAAAIRGTEFYMANVNLTERVSVFEGTVEVTFQGANYKLPAGSGVVIAEQKTAKTEKLDIKDVEIWKKSTYFVIEQHEGGQGVD